MECSAAPNAVNEAIYMVNRGGQVCLAAFTHEPPKVDIAHIVRNNIYIYGIRGEGKSATHRAEACMREKRFDATKIPTHTFPLEELPARAPMRPEKFCVCLRVMAEMGLAAVDFDGETLRLRPLPTSGKVDLGASKLLQTLRERRQSLL